MIRLQLDSFWKLLRLAVSTLVIRLQFDSVWKLLRLAVSLLLFLGSICITLMFIVGFNLKVWCSCLSDMVLWIKYCISFFVPKPWSPLCITWWSISNLYNIGLVGECYIEIGIGYYQEWWNITGKLPPCIALCWNLVAIIPSKVEAMRPHVRHNRCYFGMSSLNEKCVKQTRSQKIKIKIGMS